MKNILNIVNAYIDNGYNISKSIQEIKELKMQVDYEYTRIKESYSPNEDIRRMIKRNNEDIYNKFIIPKQNKIKALQMIILMYEDDINDFIEKISKIEKMFEKEYLENY